MYQLRSSHSPHPSPADTGSNAALPVYVQVSERLIRDIAAGRLADGARLPPERTLAGELGIAVGTLRKALALLEGKGLLQRIQGSGNYVRHDPSVESVYAMFRLELPEGGGLPRADVIGVERRPKDDDLPAFGGSTEGTRIRRRRRLDDTPVAVEEIWLDGNAGDLQPSALSESLYQTYRQVLGVPIIKAEDRVMIGPVPEWSRGHFSQPPGERVCLVERLAWTHGPIPIEFSRTWFDSDRAHYVQRLR